MDDKNRLKDISQGEYEDGVRFSFVAGFEHGQAVMLKRLMNYGLINQRLAEDLTKAIDHDAIPDGFEQRFADANAKEQLKMLNERRKSHE